MKIKLHTRGNTWKYTLDIYKLRICFYRVRKTNDLDLPVSIVGIKWS